MVLEGFDVSPSNLFHKISELGLVEVKGVEEVGGGEERNEIMRGGGGEMLFVHPLQFGHVKDSWGWGEVGEGEGGDELSNFIKI